MGPEDDDRRGGLSGSGAGDVVEDAGGRCLREQRVRSPGSASRPSCTAGAQDLDESKGFKYDDLGRVVAVARQPISGTTVTDGIAAFEYADTGTAPSRVTAYSFAVPKTFTMGAIPQTSDVVQSSVYFDALGREVQRRERLGGTGGADAAAHVVDDLGAWQFRVSGVVVYDGAGRVNAVLEPFYSASDAYVDYRASPIDALSSPAHAVVRSFDARGRVACEMFRPVVAGTVVPSSPGPCVSDFAEGPSYRRATSFAYRFYGGYLGIRIIPPENNLATTPEGRAPTGPESIFDASGRLAGTYDVDQNVTSYTYDQWVGPRMARGAASGLIVRNRAFREALMITAREIRSATSFAQGLAMSDDVFNDLGIVWSSLSKRALLRAASLGVFQTIGVEVEVWLYDTAAQSATADIFEVLSRGRDY